MIKIDVIMEKELPVKELDMWRDRIVYNMARVTLDFSNPHIPYLTGALEKSSMAFGVQGSNKEYGLGYTETTPYAKKVWNYPQNGTNWTNPNSYAKWYETTFKNNREKIIEQAVNNAKENLK